MDGIISWLIYQLPWQFQAVIVIAIATGLLFLIGMVFGWSVVKKIALPVIGFVAALVFWNKSRQDGYNARREEEDQARDKASDFAADKREEVAKLPEDQLEERVSRWEKD
jgi:hypothetical protein